MIDLAIKWMDTFIGEDGGSHHSGVSWSSAWEETPPPIEEILLQPGQCADDASSLADMSYLDCKAPGELVFLQDRGLASGSDIYILDMRDQESLLSFASEGTSSEGEISAVPSVVHNDSLCDALQAIGVARYREAQLLTGNSMLLVEKSCSATAVTPTTADTSQSSNNEPRTRVSHSIRRLPDDPEEDNFYEIIMFQRPERSKAVDPPGRDTLRRKIALSSAPKRKEVPVRSDVFTKVSNTRKETSVEAKTNRSRKSFMKQWFPKRS